MYSCPGHRHADGRINKEVLGLVEWGGRIELKLPERAKEKMAVLDWCQGSLF